MQQQGLPYKVLKKTCYFFHILFHKESNGKIQGPAL